jgi:hypothetical protein
VVIGYAGAGKEKRAATPPISFIDAGIDLAAHCNDRRTGVHHPA